MIQYSYEVRRLLLNGELKLFFTTMGDFFQYEVTFFSFKIKERFEKTSMWLGNKLNISYCELVSSKEHHYVI
ncbi:hypothetical protein LAZ67_2006822 [Cordylochernes scorpioides]|uniref:Uncharacterized protein n=1 Tax=Cordylochernes scorpioides TaxID=51811 RepID=A0ABY6K6F5_9ARAC|nr:hypothetical protein LAZ67_2006822 [Cordylochernes scorpioides]